MSHSAWSNNPNAPRIPRDEFVAEKTDFAGSFIGAIAYGIVIILFCQCMNALLNPAHRAGGNIRWPLVVHTTAMFSLVTTFTAMYLDLQSISYIDNRGFSGNGSLPPGSLGYQHLIYSKAISLIPHAVFMLNNWLADGLLLYRCCVIYAMNYWAIAFPSLMYTGSLAMGIVLIYYQVAQPDCRSWGNGTVDIGLPYFSISVALNVILTLMIVVRLVLHSRDIRDAMGPQFRTHGLYNAVISMLIESSALYAVTFVLFIGGWATSSPTQFIFFPLLAQTQVIAQFLIVLRVANRTALTKDTVSWGIGSLQFEGSSTGGGFGEKFNLNHDKV